MKHISVLPLLMMSTAAWAQATPQGAADLTAAFQTYLGSTPGVVNVVEDGDAYEITLDAGPLIAMVPAEAGVTMSASPMVMRAADNGDGTWDVTQDQPISFKVSAPNALEMDISIGSVDCEGTYSAALKAFAENNCTLGDMVVNQTVIDPNAGPSTTKQTIKEMTLTSTATAGTNGGTDGVMSYSAKGVEQTMDIPQGPGMPPLPIVATIESYEVKGTSTGVHNDAIMAAIAWLVENPSQALMAENRAGMKAIIEGGLPIFERVDATATATGLNVQTPVGPVGIATMGLDVSIKGAVADGLFREAIRLDGITPPPGVLPPFIEPLLPQSFSIDVAVDSFDAAAPAALLLGLFDLPVGGAPAPDFDMQLAQALIPDGTVQITLAPGTVANATYTLNYEGRMVAGPGGMPTGTAKVTATGYDAAMEVLNGGPDDMKQQLIPVMGMARGLAKQQADGSLLWEIDASTPGSLLVNGMDLMGMQ